MHVTPKYVRSDFIVNLVCTFAITYNCHIWSVMAIRFWSIFGPCCFSSKTELGVVLETYLFYNLLNSEYWFRLNLQKDLHLARPELRNGIRPSWCTVRCKKQSWLQIWWPTMQSSDSKIEIGMLTRSKICVECTGWRYREHSWTTWAQLQKANCWFYTKE